MYLFFFSMAAAEVDIMELKGESVPLVLIAEKSSGIYCTLV